MDLKLLQLNLEKGLTDTQSLEILKKVLTDNGYKHNQTATRVMLDSISDLISPEVYNFYSAVSINLPLI